MCPNSKVDGLRDTEENYNWEDVVKATDQKDGIIAVYFYRKISRHLVYYLANKTGITPNQITITRFFMILMSCPFLLTPNHSHLVVGGVIIQMAFILDYVDGDLARLKNLSSRIGKFLDGVFDKISINVLVFCLSISVFQSTKDVFSLVYGMMAILLFYVFDVIGIWIEKAFERNIREVYSYEINSLGKLLTRFHIDPNKVMIGYSVDITYFVLSIGAIMNQINLALFFFIVSQGVLCLYTFYKVIQDANLEGSVNDPNN